MLGGKPITQPCNLKQPIIESQNTKLHPTGSCRRDRFVLPATRTTHQHTTVMSSPLEHQH